MAYFCYIAYKGLPRSREDIYTLLYARWRNILQMDYMAYRLNMGWYSSDPDMLG